MSLFFSSNPLYTSDSILSLSFMLFFFFTKPLSTSPCHYLKINDCLTFQSSPKPTSFLIVTIQNGLILPSATHAQPQEIKHAKRTNTNKIQKLSQNKFRPKISRGSRGGEERNFSQELSIDSGVFAILLWCLKVFQKPSTKPLKVFQKVLNSMLTAKKKVLFWCFLRLFKSICTTKENRGIFSEALTELV